MACPRTSISMPGSIGSTTRAPAASREKASRPGAVGHAQHERHVAEHPARAPGRAHHRHRHRVVLPQHRVVLEEHRVGRGQAHLGHRHHSGVDLDRALAEVDLGQVAQPGASRQPESLTLVAGVQGAPQRSHAVVATGLCAWHQRHSTRWPTSVTDTSTEHLAGRGSRSVPHPMVLAPIRRTSVAFLSDLGRRCLDRGTDHPEFLGEAPDALDGVAALVEIAPQFPDGGGGVQLGAGADDVCWSARPTRWRSGAGPAPDPGRRPRPRPRRPRPRRRPEPERSGRSARPRRPVRPRGRDQSVPVEIARAPGRAAGDLSDRLHGHGEQGPLRAGGQRAGPRLAGLPPAGGGRACRSAGWITQRVGLDPAPGRRRPAAVGAGQHRGADPPAASWPLANPTIISAASTAAISSGTTTSRWTRSRRG